MPPPLSLDLRTRIIQACQEQDESQAEIAERFCVHLKTVEKLWRQWRQSGTVAPRPHAGGPPARLAGAGDALRALLAECNDRTNTELAALLGTCHGLATSAAAVSRALTRLGITRKKSRSSPASATDRTWSRAARRSRPRSPR